MFLKAIHLNPPKVSLRGYTVVSRELVTAVSINYVHYYYSMLAQLRSTKLITFSR